MTMKKTAAKKVAAPKGRPSPCPPPVKVSPFRAWADAADGEAMADLCQHIVNGGHLAGFCGIKGFAYVTVLDWIRNDKTRAELYARAREDRADMLADEIVAIADEVEVIEKMVGQGDDAERVIVMDATAIARNRLRVDARKWAASKLKPRVYGDKVQLAGDPDNPLLIGPASMTDAQLAAIAAGQKP